MDSQRRANDMFRPGGRVIIIGSGFGGSVVARRLAQANRSLGEGKQLEIILLERGRRYGSQDFPRLQLPEEVADPRLTSSKRLPDAARASWAYDQGLWQVRNLGGLRVALAAGLGGGSLIYAAVHLRAPESVFESGWPAAYRRAQLDPYYQLVEAMLDVKPSPDGWTKTERMEETYAALGRKAHAFRPPLAVTFGGPGKTVNRFGAEQSACVGCGDCIVGCQHHAKNTLDLNYLAGIEAPRWGIKVKTLAEVTTIDASGWENAQDGFVDDSDADPLDPGDNARRFTIRYRDHLLGGRHFRLRADYVFLCAGAVGSTEILLRSRDRLVPEGGRTGLAHLGEAFFANGDAPGVVFDTDRVWQPSSGPTITTALYHEDGLERDGTPLWFLLQDGGISATLTRGLGAMRSPLWAGRNAFGKPSDAAPDSEPDRGQLDLTKLLEAIPAIPQMTTAGIDAQANQPGNTADQLVTSFLPESIRTLLSQYEPPSLYLRQQVQRLAERTVFRFAERIGRRLSGMLVEPFVEAMARNENLPPATVEALIAQFPMMAALRDSQTALGVGFRALLALLLGEAPTEHTAILLAMGPDMRWQLKLENERLSAKGETAANVRLYGAQERLMREVTGRLGGELRTNPAWSISARPMSVHAQGGCSMGVQGDGGVTDQDGLMVKGIPGLYVFDGGVFPTSVGVNPSSTIAAVAERNIEIFIRGVLGLADWEAARVEDGARRGFVDSMNEKQTQWNAGPAPVLDTPATRPRRATVAVPGVRWDEVMDGFVASEGGEYRLRLPALPSPLPPEGIDEATFRTWERRGREHLQRMRAELTAVIPDIEQALRDGEEEETRIRIHGSVSIWPSHAEMMAEADGRVADVADVHPRKPRRYPVLGTLRIRVSSHGHDGSMIYRLRTNHATRQTNPGQFRLVGAKQLRDNPGLDAWKDLTTLYVNANYDGQDHAGIIRVPLLDFVGTQLPQMDVPGDDISPMRKTWWILRYFARFYGGLSQIYTPQGL
jgi:choline dehydrogenase-like flavoprotein